MSPRHRDALGGEFDRVAKQGNVEVLEPWTNAVTSQPAAISNDRLKQLAQDYLPVEISGDAIQFGINRTPNGWLVELINNRGVIKKPGELAVTDATAVARVSVKSKLSCKFAKELRSDRVHANPGVLDIEVGPGAVEFVEFRTDGK